MGCQDDFMIWDSDSEDIDLANEIERHHTSNEPEECTVADEIVPVSLAENSDASLIFLGEVPPRYVFQEETKIT